MEIKRKKSVEGSERETGKKLQKKKKSLIIACFLLLCDHNTIYQSRGLIVYFV